MSIDYFNMTFSKNLQYYMNLRGISAAELSRRIGVSRPTMSDYVHGRTLPKMDKVDAICRALSIDRKALLAERAGEDPLKEELHKLIDSLPKEKLEKIYQIVQALKDL